MFIALSPKKITVGDEGEIRAIESGNIILHCIHVYVNVLSDVAGWLIKEGKVRRKRYFVLTENALNYYKSEDTKQVLAGSIHLNW